MCSSGNCNIGGLISGPVGNLVGIGIKALVNGAPIGPRSAEALKKPTEQERIKQFYDNVESHLKGVLQVLEPALEIKKILTGESKSAERERPANSPKLAIQYYSPQHPQNSQENCCRTRRCAFKNSTRRSSTDKSNFQTPSSRSSENDKATEKNTSQLKSSTNNKSSKSKKDAPKKGSPTLKSESSNKSCCKSESKGRSSKASSKDIKTKKQSKACCICDVSLKDNIVLAVLPCQHLFCYTCLGVGNSKYCRKCDKTYDMKNVSQIFH